MELHGTARSAKTDKLRNACRAFERRFGKSILPLKVVGFFHENGGECVRIRDAETGTWADYNISGWRVTRMGEHDAAN